MRTTDSVYSTEIVVLVRWNREPVPRRSVLECCGKIGSVTSRMHLKSAGGCAPRTPARTAACGGRPSSPKKKENHRGESGP